VGHRALGVTPDIIATAKGMTAGYTPLSAIIAREPIWDTLEKNHSPFKAGHTLNANAVSCAGAIVVIHYILDHNLVENSRQRGEQALEGLGSLMEKTPEPGRCARKGLMFGFELVKDQESKRPFEVPQRASMALKKRPRAAAWSPIRVQAQLTG